jgi:CheY-like chemotaxis protein
MMKVLLESEGYEVRTAYDGPEAIEAVRGQRPHVVLLDMTLPTMSGTEVAERLRSNPELSDCCILAVTGHSETTAQGSRLFDRYFLKPVDPDALIKLVAQMTAEESLQRLCRSGWSQAASITDQSRKVEHGS